MLTNNSDDRDRSFIYSLPSASPQTFRSRERKLKPSPPSGLSPLSSDLGYCPSGRQCDGSQVVGNLSRRPLEQVAPGGGREAPQGPGGRASWRQVGLCPRGRVLPSSSLFSPPLLCCHRVFRRGRSGPSPCAASLTGLSFNTASRCKTAAL